MNTKGPTLQLTAITLRVSELARSLDFYTRQLGFVAVSRSATRAELAPATGAPALLTLLEDRRAPIPPPDAAGLFHAALVFPDRAALGRWLRFASERGVEFDGASDHGVSEALYFSDPDGNGLEFYSDRARALWPMSNGQLSMFTRALDVKSLLAAASPAVNEPLAGASWGHLHLRVTSLEKSDPFYRQMLGLELTQGTFPGARFLAADGYHHHLGLNTWGQPRQAQPAGALGLAEAAFSHPHEKIGRELRDPDGIALRIRPPVV